MHISLFAYRLLPRLTERMSIVLHCQISVINFQLEYESSGTKREILNSSLSYRRIIVRCIYNCLQITSFPVVEIYALLHGKSVKGIYVYLKRNSYCNLNFYIIYSLISHTGNGIQFVILTVSFTSCHN